MTTASKITLFRVVLIPLMMVTLYLSEGFRGVWMWISLGIFILGSLSDYLDGQIARRCNQVTDFGKFLDPLADKLLVTSALICLVELGEIAGWMVIIILAREFIITGLRAVAAGEGIIIAAGKSGKLKTILQMTALTVILLRDWPFALFTDFPVGNIILWAAVIMTVYSGIEYIVKNKQVFLS